MKNLIKTAAAAIVFSTLFAFNAVADEKDNKKAVAFETGIFANKEGKIHIAVDKYATAPTAILVEDATGKIIFHEVMERKDHKFRKALDVSELPAGNYSIKIGWGKDQQVKSFEVAEKTVERSIALN